MMVNTALDLPHHDPDTVKTVTKGLQEFEDFFVEQLRLSQENRSFNAQIKIKETAKGLMALVIGLRVLARGVYKKKDLLAIKSQALFLIQ